MANGALHDVTLGYQLLWNAQREVTGVALSLDSRPGSAVDTRHLISVLNELWHPSAPTLLLTTPSPTLLAAMLDLTPNTLAQVVIHSTLLSDPAMAQRVLAAQQRGLQLAWRGEPGQRPLPGIATSFTQHIISLSAEEALMALRVSLRKTHSTQDSTGLRSSSPVHAAQIYEGIASRSLAEHCLDQQGAAALLGWPTEDVLHRYRQTHIQPGQTSIRAMIKAIQADVSMDDIERLLGDDPALVYRFLRFTNSAGLGLNREIDSLRQGLMVLGLAHTKNWLQELLPHATQDLNLQPIRQAMVLRGHVMAELLDAGESNALQRELYLCGLLSQIDLLLSEPMAGALHAVPWPVRVRDAILAHAGPYWPYLDIATSLETPHLAATSACSDEHGFDLEDVNLALLRTLAGLKKPAKLPIGQR